MILLQLLFIIPKTLVDRIYVGIVKVAILSDNIDVVKQNCVPFSVPPKVYTVKLVMLTGIMFDDFPKNDSINMLMVNKVNGFLQYYT